jgi:hypothetical protein
MPEPRAKFSTLRHILSDLGFREVPTTKPFIGFQHDESDTWFVFPSYRSNSRVAPDHLAAVRFLLDAKGLMDADDFDRRLAEVSIRHPARS